MTNKYISVDIEADGPIPGEYSMICFGAVLVEEPLDKTFYSNLKPISDIWVPEALAVSGFSREQTLAFNSDISKVMLSFEDWISSVISNGDRPIFIADNNGFDWQFINWYFHKYLGRNPFGFSSQNLNSLYKGLCKNTKVSFKHLRKTKHTHNPVDDAKGNAEALLYMINNLNLKV